MSQRHGSLDLDSRGGCSKRKFPSPRVSAGHWGALVLKLPYLYDTKGKRNAYTRTRQGIKFNRFGNRTFWKRTVCLHTGSHRPEPSSHAGGAPPRLPRPRGPRFADSRQRLEFQTRIKRAGRIHISNTPASERKLSKHVTVIGSIIPTLHIEHLYSRKVARNRFLTFSRMVSCIRLTSSSVNVRSSAR